MSGYSFAERFKSHSNAQLLNVLQNRKQYQYAAVKAAEEELNNRNLDSTAMEAAHQELNEQAVLAADEKRKREELRDKIKSAQQAAIKNAESVLSARRSSTQKGIIVLCIVFGLQLVWFIDDQGSLLHFMLTAPNAKWDISALFLFLPACILPPALILLLLKKKAGWALMVFHIGYTILSSLFLCIGFMFKWGNSPVSPATFITGALFFGTTLYFLMTRKVRESYKIGKNTIGTVIIVSLIVAALSARCLFDQ